MIQTTVTESRFDTRPEVVGPTDIVVATRLTWWGPVVAGAFAAISIQVIFALLGMAIGLTIAGTADNPPEQGLAIGAGVYWLITGLVSLFAGGWIAGWLCPLRHRYLGAIHGFLTWCTVTVVSVWFLTMTGGVALGGTLSAMAGVVGTAAVNDASTRNIQPASLQQPLEDAPPARDEQPALTEQEREDAAQSAAVASWWTLVALVLGAAVATLGGTAGVKTELSLADDRYGRKHTGARGTVDT